MIMNAHEIWIMMIASGKVEQLIVYTVYYFRVPDIVSRLIV